MVYEIIDLLDEVFLRSHLWKANRVDTRYSLVLASQRITERFLLFRFFDARDNFTVRIICISYVPMQNRKWLGSVSSRISDLTPRGIFMSLINPWHQSCSGRICLSHEFNYTVKAHFDHFEQGTQEDKSSHIDWSYLVWLEIGFICDYAEKEMVGLQNGCVRMAQLASSFQARNTGTQT